MAESPKQEPKKGNNKIGLIIGFAVILLGTNGYQYWQSTQDEAIIAEKEQVITVKENDNKRLISQLDSVQVELEARAEEITRLGGDADSLNSIITQLKKDKAALRSQVGNAVVLKRSIEEYKTILAQKDDEIARYKATSDSLFKENTGLKTEKVKILDSISNITAAKQQLAQQVAVASILRAENIKITAVNKKGKEVVGAELKGKHIDKLKIVFNLGDNKVAKVETKTVYIRLIGPDGAAIFDESTGGGSITIDGKQLYYTAKQDILFDNRKPQVSFLYSKGNEYAKGKHTVEVYCEDNRIGEGAIIVK